MTRKPLNIVFWGEDAFSNVILTSLIEAGHQVRFVVTPYYENFVYKRLELTCNKNNIPLLRAKKINSEESLKEEANLIDGAYITTFDSFSLSMVKKYHTRLNITNNIKICDEVIIDLEKHKILDEILDRYLRKSMPANG